MAKYENWDDPAVAAKMSAPALAESDGDRLKRLEAEIEKLKASAKAPVAAVHTEAARSEVPTKTK